MTVSNHEMIERTLDHLQHTSSGNSIHPDLLDWIANETLPEVKLAVKGLSTRFRDHQRAEVSTQYPHVINRVVTQLDTEVEVTKSMIEDMFVQLGLDLDPTELKFHADTMISALLSQGVIYYMGSHYRSAEWRSRQNYDQEFLRTHPFLVIRGSDQLASGDADSLAPAEERVRSLGQLASGQSVTDSQS